MTELNEEKVLNIMKSYGNDAQQLIAVLLDIQAASGHNCVEQKWADMTAKTLDVPLSKVYDILTFYAMFSTEPRGENVVEICQSTPCHFTQADEVVGWFEAAAGIKVDQTTADRKITLCRTSCVGACDVGPVAKIGDDVFGNLTADKVKTLVKSYLEGQPQMREALICQN